MSQRALLVIDVQNEYFNGDPPITYPHNHLDNILNVMDDAAAADVPVVVVQHTFLTDELPLSQRGTPEWELHEEVAERPHDFHVENNTLALENQAGQVTDEELQRAILCAQQMLLSEVIASHDWLQRL